MVKRRTRRRKKRRRRRKNIGKGMVFGKCALGEDSQARREREEVNKKRLLAIRSKERRLLEDAKSIRRIHTKSKKHKGERERNQRTMDKFAKAHIDFLYKKAADRSILNDLQRRYKQLPESAKLLNSGKGLRRKTKRKTKRK